MDETKLCYYKGRVNQGVTLEVELNSFALFFSELRENSGYKSQRELAEKSGISHSTINRIEAGTHKVSPETLKALAPYLKNTSYEELMKKAGYVDDESTSSHNRTNIGEMSFYGGPDAYSQDEIEVMEAALKAYREQKEKLLKQNKKKQTED
ncbi:helix-turn-helix domain-containing protein [Paenibacillus sepulcri]|uniref:Helix-turn-helix domain-containing protein n=1 Tax=Paenibacillus sepulcri TaxID=359917 RepID=A0ABS7BZ59_9BACL|nr:helix-turn-helix domain-containing protein [Paenibacillus sepulcri]